MEDASAPIGKKTVPAKKKPVTKKKAVSTQPADIAEQEDSETSGEEQPAPHQLSTRINATPSIQCAAGDLCQLPHLPVDPQHHCRTCDIPMHNPDFCGKACDSDDPRNHLKYPGICHQCLNSKLAARPEHKSQSNAITKKKKAAAKQLPAVAKKATGSANCGILTAASQKTPSKANNTAVTLAANKKKTSSEKAKKTAACKKAPPTTNATVAKTIASKKTLSKIKVVKMKEAAPIIPNCTPLAFRIEEHENWIKELPEIPRSYLKQVNGRLYLFGNVIQCTNRKEGKYKIEFSHTNIAQTEMQAYALYKAMDLRKLLQEGPAGAQQTNVFPLSSSLEQALNTPLKSQENQGESILSDCECDTDEEEEGEEQEVRTRDYISTDLQLNLNFPSLRQYEPSNTEWMSGIKWDVGLNGEVTTDVPSPTNLASNKKSYIPGKFKAHFSSPLSSFLAFFPIEFWRLVVKRTNEYALWEKEFGERKLYEKWQPTDLPESPTCLLADSSC
ncbi:unnamed protein product [Cylindrotheca closterium]|uniref:Uncharacterized protein n=1 Tax=Cylindrotheca closterium TaxID=2856 RepID=A0AAD2CMP6_9STRA|nr:unnamed protein product [Cylindrotheca closterium]